MPPCRRLSVALLPPGLALVLALSACLPGPGAGPSRPAGGTPGEEIAVTALPAAAGGPKGPPPGAPPPAAAAPAAAAAADPAAAPPPETPPPETQPPEAPPPEPLSPAALACQRKGGTWAGTGAEGQKACVRTMPDAGQTCRSGADCDGACLARSGTCAPIDPLFGCHDLLDDLGRRVTRCLD
jgi:hypothetical protein